MQRMAKGLNGNTVPEPQYYSTSTSRPAGMSDEDLATRAALHNDAEAFSLLVDRYRARLCALCKRMLSAGGMSEEAEDTAQDAFVAAYHARAMYRPGEPYRAWIYRIVVNRCVDKLRSGARKPRRVSIESIGEPGADAGPLEQLISNERESRLRHAIDKLPDKYRAVFLLRHLDDLSYEEIAVAVELPLGTVKTHLFRARAQLRESLKDVLESAR
jgi:RNA polymerase sigma-70 factor (ECF subfamily)